MNTYLIIGLVILVAIVVFFMMKKGRKDEGEKFAKMKQEMQEIIAYDMKDEQKIRDMLPKMGVQEMASLADKITKKNIGDTKFLDAVMPEDVLDKIKQLLQGIDQEGIDQEGMNQRNKAIMLSPTVFGNMAFLSINTKEPYASRAKAALELLRSHTNS